METWGAAVIPAGGPTRLLVLLTSSFYALQKVYFFVQLDGAATRCHHEITTLYVVIVKNMGKDINIEIF